MKIIAILIGLVTIMGLLVIWLSAGGSPSEVVAQLDAPSSEEVASCQELIDGFKETVEEARRESKEKAVEAAVTASGMYMLTDCADVMQRAREAGLLPED